MRQPVSQVLQMWSVEDGEQGENAVSYYIVASAREIHVGKDGTLTPAGGAAGNAKAVAITLTLYRRVTGEDDQQKIGYWELNGTPPGVTLVDEPESTASLRLRVDTSVAVNVPVTVYDSVIDLQTSQPVKGAWLADITIPLIRDGADGQSVIICDFDDEMTQIPCDSEGKVVGTFPAWSTTGHLMRGTAELPLAEAQCSYEVIAGALSCGLAVEGTTATFTVNGFGNNAIDENKVRVTLGDAAGNSKSQVLTVAKNRSGAPGIAPDIYQLSPTPTNLALDADGNLKESSFTVRVKKNGMELESLPASPALTLSVKTTFKSGTTRTGGYNLYSPIPVASLPDSSGIPVKDIVSVELTLKEGTKVHDVETLYMLADGAKGTGVTVRGVTYAVTTTGTRPADTAFIYPSFPSVPAGTYVWSRTEYSDGSVVYSVSRAGKDGHAAELRFKLSNTKPTDNPSNGTGWVTDIPSPTPGFTVKGGQWQQGSAGWYESPATEHDSTSMDTVAIETFGDNAEVEILYRASTETLEEDGGMTGYDNGYIGALDADNPVNNYLKEFSGLESGSVKITIPKAGRHFIRIAYHKDASDDYYVHDDKIYYKINNTRQTAVTGVWRVEAIEWNDNGSVKTWSDPVRINGIDPSLSGRIEFKEWILGESYQSGQEGEECLHIVPYNNAFYACRISIEHAAAEHVPGPNSGYWFQASPQNFIASVVFYAMNAFIEKLTVSNLITQPTEEGVFAHLMGGRLEFYNPQGVANLKIGIEDGMVALKFYDNQGTLRRLISPGTDYSYSGEGTPQQSVSSTWEVWKIWITDSTTPTAGKGGTVGEQYYRFVEGYERNGQSKIYDFGGAYNGMFYLSESVNSDGAPIPSNRVPDGYYSHNGNSAYYKTAWVQDPTATVGPNEPIPEVARDIYRYPVYHIENGRITETLYVYFYYDSSQIIRPCSGDGYDFPDLDYQFLWRYLHIV